MLTYVSLFRFTQQGIQNIDSVLERYQAVRAKMAEAGGELVCLYVRQGQYDLVAISRWSDEYKAMALNLWLGKQGNVRSGTLRAFDEGELRKILGK